jgi:uncharacterized protein YwgA
MDKKEIILLLLKSNKRPIVGSTRLQKLLFLVEKENNIQPENDGFKFEAYKYGPASKGLYDDIDFLAQIGFIEKSNDKDKLIDLDINNIESYSSELFLQEKEYVNNDPLKTDNLELLIDDKDEITLPIEPEEKDSVVYRITDDGLKYLKDNNLLETNEDKSISSLTKKYGNYSITSLLQYVYRNYPDYTGESEIKDRIL